jgi:hypothetical protein
METPYDGMQAMSQAWMQMVGRMSSAATACSANCDPQEASQHVRNAALTLLTQFTDQFLRSPPFLQIMKQSLDSSVAMRQQLNDVLTQLHHSTQGVARADVDSLMRCVRESERRTLDRLEVVAGQLEQIAQRLEALEKRASGNGADVKGREAGNV